MPQKTWRRLRLQAAALMVLALLLTAAAYRLSDATAKFISTTGNSTAGITAMNSFKLIQQAGTAGCISETGTSGACINGKGLDYPSRAAISPDGKHLYTVSYYTEAVDWLVRDPDTGQLSQSATSGDGCVSATSAGSIGCTSVADMDYPMGVAVSPDGKNVYVTAGGTRALFVFNRNATTGALTKAACHQETGLYGCQDAKGIAMPEGVVVSADGKNVYVAALNSDAVATFSRNTTTGLLTQDTSGSNGCISDDGTNGLSGGELASCVDGRALADASAITMSPDDKFVYVNGEASDAVAILTRNTTTGVLTQAADTTGCISNGGSSSCATGRALDVPKGITLSPDGAYAYVGTSDSGSAGLAIFSRNATTGALTQLSGLNGCITASGTSGTCTADSLFNGIDVVGVSPDGQNVYAPSPTSDAIHTLYVDPATGNLSHLSDTRRCISETGSSGVCVDGKGLDLAYQAVVSPDGMDVYVTSANSDAVAVFTRLR